MNKENNITNKIIEVFYKESPGDKIVIKEKLNKEELENIRNEICPLNITRLYEYDVLIASLGKYIDLIYPLIDILDRLWLESFRTFKEDYSIDRFGDILSEVNDNVDDILTLSYEDIVKEIKKLGY